MNWKVLDKLITKTIKDKFPEQIDEVILSQDDFGEYKVEDYWTPELLLFLITTMTLSMRMKLKIILKLLKEPYLMNT